MRLGLWTRSVHFCFPRLAYPRHSANATEWMKDFLSPLPVSWTSQLPSLAHAHLATTPPPHRLLHASSRPHSCLLQHAIIATAFCVECSGANHSTQGTLRAYLKWPYLHPELTCFVPSLQQSLSGFLQGWTGAGALEPTCWGCKPFRGVFPWGLNQKTKRFQTARFLGSESLLLHSGGQEEPWLAKTRPCNTWRQALGGDYQGCHFPEFAAEESADSVPGAVLLTRSTVLSMPPPPPTRAEMKQHFFVLTSGFQEAAVCLSLLHSMCDHLPYFSEYTLVIQQ